MTKRAEQRIAECKQARARELDIGSDSELTEIPRSIHELVWLEHLRISNTQIQDLEPLAALSSLRSLEIGYTPIKDLSPLAGLANLSSFYAYMARELSDLAALARLMSLTSIDVDGTAVADLGPIADLTNLARLDISKTFVSDLRALIRLKNLREFNAPRTRITDLSPLTQLSQLQLLNVAGTAVVDLTPLSQLSGLTRVNLSSTEVVDLHPLIPLIEAGVEVSWTKGGVNGVFVEDCPLTSPPPEIAKQGNAAILNYFRERDIGDVDYLYEAKLLVLGEGGSGKTSLVRRLYQPGASLPGEQESTKGIDIHRHEFVLKNGRHFRLNVWDFGGQEIYHATHQFFLTRRSLYLLLDDTRKDHKSVSDEGFKYWLDLIDLFGGHSPVLIFQNEKGGRSKAIDIGGIKGQYDNVKDRYAGNLEEPTTVAPLRDAIEFHASQLSHIGEELPARWVKVRADIETTAAVYPHISQQQYFDIYRRHIEFDRTRALHLSRYLHDLGVFLHFQDDPLLSRTVILQNRWATEAVFRILDDEEVKKQFGRFTGDDCSRLWRDSVYADMHLELLALMQQFEMCYLLPDSRPRTWLAPQLLPPAKPTALQGWTNAASGDLVLRFRYAFLPKGTISRLTVRMHRWVTDPGMAWTTGVLFQRDDTQALVEVLPTGGEIELRARGPERKALLSVIAADLEALNDSYRGLQDRVEKRIPCNCKMCTTAPTPEFFAQRSLRKRVEDRRLTVECPRSYEDVNVVELLDGFNAIAPSWSAKNSDAGLRTIRVFLASSSELREDRDAFDLHFRQKNDLFRKQGLYLEVVRWESFLDAISETRLQDEYNKAIRSCDVFVSLFFTKTGKFTEEEFDAAHRQFQTNRRPLIYTFFKNADIKTGSARREDLTSLWAFQERLKSLGHFHSTYDNIDQLKQKFRDQLDKMLDAGL